MEESGYVCPRRNGAAQNQLLPLRKQRVLWRCNAPHFLQSHCRILKSSDSNKGFGGDMMHRYRLMY